MKLLSLFFLFLCLMEIYGQRIRTNTNQDVSTEEPKTPRGRGRSRFSVSEELPSSSERPVSNRRASTRTRIHSNNPKAVADRRARPTTEAPRSYAVEEINNDSPIDSFVRQSKPRVLTESRFEIPTVTVTRRPQLYQSVRASPPSPVVEDITVGGFGSTARAILQARGEPLPVRTTTPVIDEAYLLNNFGSTIRSLKAAIRNDVPIQRATPLRSEVPILDQEDIPLRRSSLRGDPLPSLRGSDINLESQSYSRGRTRGQSLQTTEQTRDNVRTSSRNNSSRKTIEQTRANGRLESQKKVIEDSPVEEITRLEPETEAPEVPESVQGILEESDIVTETLPVENGNELSVNEEEELRKSSGAEFLTQKVTEPDSLRQTVVSNRRAGARGRTDSGIESQSTVAPRQRASRTRAPQGTVEIYTAPSSRSRGGRRRNYDADVAESRNRGPSVFTAEQYQEVTSRSRTGRKIDSRFESLPERITVDLTPVASGRTRSPGRRGTTAGTTSTERSAVRDRSSLRGRSRSRVILEESTTATVSKTSYSRRPASTDDTAFYGDKTSGRADIDQTIARGETSGRLDIAEPKVVKSRGSAVETPSNRRAIINRQEKSRSLTAGSRRQPTSRIESVEARNSGYRQNDQAVSNGEKPSRTRAYSQQITTTTEEPTTIINRSKSRFSEVPPNIDESKLEVLPLFERESKTVPSARSKGQRSRSIINRRHPTPDHMQGSATENDVKFVEKPTTNAFTKVTVTRSQSVDASTSRTRLSTRTASTTASTSTTDTTRRPTYLTTTRAPETSTITKKWTTRAPPMIKESVVAEVNEVTSKSTFMRRKKVSKAKANEVLARGSKKADVKLTEKRGSSEEIGDEDNYPEPFKALIQAKKNQVNVVESRPSQSSPRSSLSTISISSTEKVFVTSPASPRGSSSTARVVTTESPSKRSQIVKEIVNDNDNELEPKATIISTTPITPTRSARSRQPPRFSEKPKYTQKPREKFTKSTITEKPRYSIEKGSTKTTTATKKPYSTKLYSTRDPVEHHSRRKALRSTALPPSTTPMNLVNREAKFSAKFIRKEKSFDTNSAKNPQTKSSFSSKKGGEEEEKAGKNVPLTQTPKPSLPIKKFNANRYSARYRSDPSQRSSVLRSTTTAPFYIPTIPTPAYVPTVPTIAPSVTPVGGIVAKKDKDLGLEVISFDDPVNTIQSADLVNGEYLTTDKNIRLSAMVKDGTTEKTVSIIERIINSITAISTTEAPNITTTTSPTSTSIEASKNSAILKLVTKKPTTKDKTIPDYQTNIIETITSEKPTTIIEKIRSSLSAIQSNEVGTSDFNTVISSTTPLSTVTKYSAKFRGGSVGTTALPAPLPLSTSINPLSVFDEIDQNQVLEKRTIGKLLNILNGLVSTTLPERSEKLVVVTPKNILNSGSSPRGFTATTFSPQEPLEAISLNDIKSRAGFIDSESFVSSSTVNTDSTTLGFTVNTESSTLSSIVNTDFSNLGTETVSISNTESSTQIVQNNTDKGPTPTTSSDTGTSWPENNEISPPMSIQTTTPSSTTLTLSTSTVASFPTANIQFPESTANSLSIDSSSTSTSIIQEPTTTVTPDSSTSSVISEQEVTSNVEGFGSSILYTFPSTLPTIPNIEVESNRMARLLENEQTSPTITPRFAITSSTPSSTTVVSNTTPLTPNESKISTTSSLPSTASMDSTAMSSTTTPGTTMMFTSTLSSSTTTQGTSTTMPSNIVEIMAVPGATRISKAQTTTTAESSTVESSTTQASTSTIAQSTETIQPTLGDILNGEILNGKTVNALASLLSSTELSKAKAPNFKTLEINQYNEVLNIQDLINRNNGNVVYRWKPVTKSEYKNIKNSFTSATSVQSTSTEQPLDKAPFTSPMLNIESTTQFPTSEDRLLSSTLISTLMPASTTTQEPKTQRVIITSTTPSPPTTTTTTLRTTTQQIETTTQRLTTTVKPKVKTTGAPKSTTEFQAFTPSTIFPTILTTLFPSLLRNAATTQRSTLSTTGTPFTSPDLSNRVRDRFELLSTAGTTARPTTVLPQTTSQRISTTITPTTTTTRQSTTQTTTESTSTFTTPTPTTTMKSKPTTTKAGKSVTVTPSTKEETDALFNELKKSGKLRNLNEEQRKNLEEIERIENEQAELLKQLTLLTTMFGGQAGKLPNLPPLPNNNPLGGNSNSLANRVIAMAMERDRGARSSTTDPSTVTTKKSAQATTKRPNSIQDQLPVSQEGGVTQRTTPSLEDVLRQYNLSGLSTPVPLSATYGKTDEALLAAILKEQGIGPTTPRILGDKVKEAGLFEENATTKPSRPKSKPKPRPTTTVRPVGGRLMQGLNWLLDILDPPTTKRPGARKPKSKPQPSKQSSGDEELLTNQPTRITPVVTAAPVTKPNLSQEEIQILIKQLEAVQNDPDAADQLDFSKIKNLQNLINVNEGVQVTSAGQHGATSRATPRPSKITTKTTERDPFLTEINKKPRSSTVATLSVSNSIDDDDVELISTTTTPRTRVLPPVSLNPIPGIDNQGDSLIRSNLLTAAVNVTRAISSFLGSALQDAAVQVRSMFSGGSNVLTNISGGFNVPSIASGSGGIPGSNPSRSS